MSVPNKNLLFVTYGGGHAAMIGPVLHALRNDSLRLDVLGLTMAIPYLRREGIPFVTFRDFVTPADGEALRRGEELAQTMHQDHTGIPREESVAYLGLSYHDLASRLGEAEAARRFAAEGRMAFLPLSVMERIFDRLRPDVVITTPVPRAEQAAREVARRRGIPLVVLTDLLGINPLPLQSDHLCVTCEPAREKYQADPRMAVGKIHVTGNPAMDPAAAFQGPPDPRWRAECFPGLPPGARSVLSTEQVGYLRSGILTRFTPEEILANLDLVHRACRQAGAALLVRPHPSLPPEIYLHWVARQPAGTAAMAHDVELYPLLRSCDLVISNLSTVMLNALYSDRNVLLLRYPEDTTTLPFDQLGYAFGAPANDVDALRAAIVRALEDPAAGEEKRRSFRRDFPALPCAPRVAEVIRSCLS